MVGEVGVAPTVFLMSRIYSPLPSLLGTLAHIGGWYRICTYDAWVAATSLSLLGEPPLWCRGEELNPQPSHYK